jgi:hypothetical protein
MCHVVKLSFYVLASHKLYVRNLATSLSCLVFSFRENLQYTLVFTVPEEVNIHLVQL